MTVLCPLCGTPVILAHHVRSVVTDLEWPFDPEPHEDGEYLINHTSTRGTLFARPGGSPEGVRARYEGQLHQGHICAEPPEST